MDFASLYFWDMTFAYYEVGVSMTNWTVSSQNFQDFLKIKQHFDVVVVETNLAWAWYAL